MALFQNAVLKKYLHDLDNEDLQLKWQVFKLHFPYSKTIQDWHALSFSNFLKELTKQKIKLSLSEQVEWMQHFEMEKAKANAIQKTIDETDKEIDRMVYELYELTEDEIRIVEEIKYNK